MNKTKKLFGSLFLLTSTALIYPEISNAAMGGGKRPSMPISNISKLISKQSNGKTGRRGPKAGRNIETIVTTLRGHTYPTLNLNQFAELFGIDTENENKTIFIKRTATIKRSLYNTEDISSYNPVPTNQAEFHKLSDNTNLVIYTTESKKLQQSKRKNYEEGSSNANVENLFNSPNYASTSGINYQNILEQASTSTNTPNNQNKVNLETQSKTLKTLPGKSITGKNPITPTQSKIIVDETSKDLPILSASNVTDFFKDFDNSPESTSSGSSSPLSQDPLKNSIMPIGLSELLDEGMDVGPPFPLLPMYPEKNKN